MIEATYLGKKVDPTNLYPGDIKLDPIALPEGNTASITFTSDEVTAKCPITLQPDFYTIEVILFRPKNSIETKSLKLYLQSWANLQAGIFAEALANLIAGDIQRVSDAETTRVLLTQKSRGGIVLKVECLVERVETAHV